MLPICYVKILWQASRPYLALLLSTIGLEMGDSARKLINGTRNLSITKLAVLANFIRYSRRLSLQLIKAMGVRLCTRPEKKWMGLLLSLISECVLDSLVWHEKLYLKSMTIQAG